MAERNLDFDKITDRRNTNCLKYDFVFANLKKEYEEMTIALYFTEQNVLIWQVCSTF